MSNYYDTLGLPTNASQDDIKRSYRQLARQLHPDVNSDPGANEQFLALQLAYEVLSDERRKTAYDEILAKHQREKTLSAEERKREKEAKEAEELRLRAEARMRDHAPAAKVDPVQTDQLMALLNANKFSEAERLALQMLAGESRQPVPYAVLGDIARFRGETKKAIQFYGYAAQYEPTNPLYQKMYEQLLNRQPTKGPASSAPVTEEPAVSALGIGAFAVCLMAVYVALAQERPIGLAIAPALTLGAIVMLFISGVVIGSCLILSKSIEGFNSTSGSALMKVPPAVSIGVISLVSFWLACLVYGVIGHQQQTFNRSLSLFLAVIGAVTLVFSLAGLAKGPTLTMNILVWGGSFACLGGIVGWYVTDRLKHA